MNITEVFLNEDDINNGGPNQNAERAAKGALQKAFQLMTQGEYMQASKMAQRAAYILDQIANGSSF